MERCRSNGHSPPLSPDPPSDAAAIEGGQHEGPVASAAPAALDDDGGGSNGWSHLDAACNDIELSFMAVPPLGSGRALGPICSVRHEIVDLAHTSGLVLLHGDNDGDAGFEERSIDSHAASQQQQQYHQQQYCHPPQPALVIERLVRGSVSTVAHIYSLTSEPLRVLDEAGEDDDDDALREDSHILRFALASKAASAPVSRSAPPASQVICEGLGGSGARAAIHKRLRPLQRENAVLRGALGLGRVSRPIDAAAARAAVVALQRQYHAAVSEQRRDNNSSGASSDPAAFVPTSSVRSVEVPAGISSDAAAPSDLHSPLAWESETVAAVNARTRYDPYRRASPHSRRHVLDAVTQHHLVTRLHDKSTDERNKRLMEHKEKIERELGLHERRVLSPEEQQNLAQRLHDLQQEHTKKVLEDAAVRAHGPPQLRRVFSPAEQRASNERIYREPCEKTRRVMQRLFEQYILAEEEKAPRRRLSPEQQKAMGDRLSQRHR